MQTFIVYPPTVTFAASNHPSDSALRPLHPLSRRL